MIRPQMTETVFADLGFSDSLLKAIDAAGYTKPTEIQEKAIPYVLQGRDVIGIARTGTGKTASFTLPMIEILSGGNAKARMPRALVLSPTRELAAQIAENFDKYGKYNHLTKALIVGGVAATDQLSALQRGVDVVIATPGRLLDLFERGSIMLHDNKMLVIDEADRMLDMGFIPDIERIVKLLPPLRQTLLFSATMPDPVKKLAEKFMSSPRTVSAAPPASPAETVSQYLVPVKDNRSKQGALLSLIRDPANAVVNAFVFCNRKRDIATLASWLEKQGIKVGALHGDMHQSKRTETLNAFKSGAIDILVCSDVAARGLDISGVSHVFNIDVPFNSDDYVHRIGRTGRAGKTGVSFTFATPDDDKSVTAVEKLIGKAIPRLEVSASSAPARSEGDEPRESRREGRGRDARRRDEKPRGEHPRREDKPRGESRDGSRDSNRDAAREERRPHGDKPRSEGDHKRDGQRNSHNGGPRDAGRDSQRPRHNPRDDADDVASGPGFGDHLPGFMSAKKTSSNG